MSVTLLFVYLTVVGLAAGRNFNLQNNLEYPVWVGILGNDGMGQPENGGFALYPGQWVSKNWRVAGVELGLPKEIYYVEATEKNTITLHTTKFYINYFFRNVSSFTPKQSRVNNSL
jgi:hypothetical protein